MYLHSIRLSKIYFRFTYVLWCRKMVYFITLVRKPDFEMSTQTKFYLRLSSNVFCQNSVLILCLSSINLTTCSLKSMKSSRDFPYFSTYIHLIVLKLLNCKAEFIEQTIKSVLCGELYPFNADSPTHYLERLWFFPFCNCF